MVLYDYNDPDAIVDFVISDEGRQMRILDIVDILKAAYARYPDHVEVAHQLAVHCSKGFHKQDNDALAEEAFEKAFDLDPTHTENIKEYCRFLIKQDRFEEAENLCADLLANVEEKSHEEAVAFKELAHVYLKWADKVDPEHRDYCFALARAAAHVAYDMEPENWVISDTYEKAQDASDTDYAESDLDILEERINNLFSDDEDASNEPEPEPVP